MVENEEEEEENVVVTVAPSSCVSFTRTFAYSVGHFLNDLCACMWFNYLVLFLEKVLRFTSVWAGFVILLGQVTDACATPLVGYLCDHSDALTARIGYGQRKTWHLIGTVLVVVSFPFIFKCFACHSDVSDTYQVLYFVPFVMLFQIGWATVQVSHLSLIPELAKCQSTRTTLNGLRNVFTVIANVLVFAVIMFILGEKGSGSSHDKVSYKDINGFMYTDYIVVGIGIFTTIFFHFGTKEPRNLRQRATDEEDSSDSRRSTARSGYEAPKMLWTDWLKEHQFYQVALLYMCSRLYINVSQVYLSFYVQYSQNFSKKYVAVFPLVVCCSSFVVSSLLSMPFLNRQFNRKLTYLFGATVGVMTCIWMWYVEIGNQMYGIASGLGIAQAVVLVTSLAITSDLINVNTESGAFVYGAMSFTDKLCNGITYQIIQLINPICNIPPHERHPHCMVFYRNVMVFVPGIALLLALVVLVTMMPQKIGMRRSGSADRDPLLNETE